MTIGIQVNELSPEKIYMVAVLCRDCGKQLMESKPLTGQKIRDDWALMVTSAPLACPSCPNGCRATYSDCNANTDFEIRAAEHAKASDQPSACPACGTLPEELTHDPSCPLATAGN
jgi:hypothetical protein